MYAGYVACCLLVRHIEYAPRALFTLEKKIEHTDGQMPDRRTTLDAASVKMADQTKLAEHKIHEH